MNEGRRLERFVHQRWGREKGGIRGLAAEMAPMSPDTIYNWFNGKAPPDAEQLQRLANALGVKRYEIMAAMDGVGPVGPLATDQLDERIRAFVEAALEARGYGEPRPLPRRRSHAT